MPVDQPERIVDLGCGPGPLTAALGRRWPQSTVVGVDNDDAMVGAAQSHVGDNVRFELADIGTWVPDAPVDVIVANAAFQWVPGHRDRLATWASMLRPGGTLAFQVPGNLDDPHHQAIRALRSSPQWRSVARLGVPIVNVGHPLPVSPSLRRRDGVHLTADPDKPPSPLARR